jgi:eukaryotic-like serine/threonine-protein kinase
LSLGRAQLRRIVTLLAVIASAAAAGYVVTCAIFPAPILSKLVNVPALRGAPADSAVTWLARLGLRGRLTDTVNDPLTPIGTVAWQSPVAETQLPQGALVRIGVSGGAPLVSMPDVTDLDLGLARQVVEASGLQPSRIDTVRDDADLGIVLATVPAAGVTARPGDPVRITVSSGPPSVRVPDLAGLSVAAARERLAAAGLRVGIFDQRFEGKAGTVLAQSPGPGELVTKESGVNLTISGTLP